jgi:hypothetical protein
MNESDGTRECRCSLAFHRSTGGDQLVGLRGGKRRKAGSHNNNLSDFSHAQGCYLYEKE